MPMYFFFSSRRRHTRYIGDWSSDVCSSDLEVLERGWFAPLLAALRAGRIGMVTIHVPDAPDGASFETIRDRKSTRLNSSHRCISYAVFCLKKKNYKTGQELIGRSVQSVCRR